jgi:hypothetical protein
MLIIKLTIKNGEEEMSLKFYPNRFIIDLLTDNKLKEFIKLKYG